MWTRQVEQGNKISPCLDIYLIGRAKELSILHAQDAPEKRGLVQQLQFWRRDSSKSSEPEEAHEPVEATKPVTQQLPLPQHLGEQDGALDDVDTLMARLAEQQVSQHTSSVCA